MRCVFTALFSLGLSLPLAVMVVAILSRAVAAVAPLVESIREKVPFVTASMKEHRIRTQLMGVYVSRQGSDMSDFCWNSNRIRQLMLHLV